MTARTRSTANRTHGRPVEGLSAHHFVGFIQNHDQVGNRATGDRLEQIVGLRPGEGGGGAGADGAVYSAYLSGRGVRGVHAVPLLCRSRGPGDGEGSVRGTPARVRGLWLGS